MKVAVFGVGSFGQHHARIVNDLDDVSLEAVVDSDSARGAEIGEKLSVPCLTDFESVKDRIDAAVLVTPTSVHGELARSCLSSGIHVFVEKPITSTSSEAKELLHLANDNNLVLHVGHVERFNPAFLAIRDSITNPRYIEARRISSFPARIKDADVVLDMMIHDLDIVLSLMKSKVTEIKAIGMKVLTDKADMAHVRLEFANGGVANVSASRVGDDSFRKLRVFEKAKYFSVDFLNRSSYWSQVEESNGKREISANKPELFYKEPLQLELSDFFSAIRNEENDGVTGEEGYAALKLAEEIVESMRYK